MPREASPLAQGHRASRSSSGHWPGASVFRTHTCELVGQDAISAQCHPRCTFLRCRSCRQGRLLAGPTYWALAVRQALPWTGRGRRLGWRLESGGVTRPGGGHHYLGIGEGFLEVMPWAGPQSTCWVRSWGGHQQSGTSKASWAFWEVGWTWVGTHGCLVRGPSSVGGVDAFFSGVQAETGPGRVAAEPLGSRAGISIGPGGEVAAASCHGPGFHW